MIRTGAYFFSISSLCLNRWVESIGRWLKQKPLQVPFTEMHCSLMGEMSTKMHLGSILVNSAIRLNFGKILENALTVQQSDGSS